MEESLSDNTKNPGAGERPWRPNRLRAAAVAVILATALAVFASVADQHYPLRAWLFFMVMRYWLFSLFFAGACLSAGLAATRCLLPTCLRVSDRWTFAFALGAVIFALGIFFAGVAGLLGRIFFFAWPCLLWPLGMREFVADIRYLRRQARRARGTLFLPQNYVEVGALILLVLSLVAIYMQVMTPANLGADSYWYHLPIAEHYVARGAIRPFAEGWYLGAYPQLATLLYTWAFLSPGELFDHIALCSHIEWVLFLPTLLGVSALVRHLLGSARLPYAAAAMFLFPGIFLYDSSLITGADHIHAFFAPALGLGIFRLLDRFDRRNALAVGILTAGPLLTKYQGVYFFVPVSILVLWLAVSRKKMMPALVWGVALAAVTSVHWLKNWIWYGDPLYPLLHKYLAARPFYEGAGPHLEHEYWAANFLLSGSFWHKVQATLSSLVTFSFVPHNWGFHGDRPVFGSLFTLLIPVALLLGRRKRLWLMILGVHIAIGVWFATSHQDRFLQALLPWMAACTATILVMAWQLGLLVRAMVTLLVAFQLIWGADVYFLRAHAMVGDSPLKSLVDYASAGHYRRYSDQRAVPGGVMKSIGERLPPHAKLLIHDRHDRLGIMAETITDGLGWQGAIDYMLLETPDEAAKLWRKLGATHAMWWTDRGGMSPEALAREASFVRTVEHGCESQERVDNKAMCKLTGNASNPVLASHPTKIAWLGCEGDPELGVYSPSRLASRSPERSFSEADLRKNPVEALRDANALVVRPSCGYWEDISEAVERDFNSAIKAGEVAIWVRR
jgi:hypothetical protein